VSILRTKIAFPVILGIICFCISSYTHAAIDIQEDDIIVQVSPSAPQSYQDVTITLSSYATNLNTAQIEWTKSGIVVLTGFGKTSYTFKTDGPDIPSDIGIQIVINGTPEPITKQLVITPSDVELLWEAVDSYTPPFYKGKALPTQESTVRVTAIPSTKLGQARLGNISYTWKKNDTTQSSASGYKKNVFSFKNDIIETQEKISVDVTSIDNTYTATKSIRIPIVQPELYFYQKNEETGIRYSEILPFETPVLSDEITIVAEPYFLNLKNKTNTYTYQWKINGERIETPLYKKELTIRPTEKGGYATISVIIDGVSSLYQKIQGTIRLTL
jgi:hypothetical protein